MSYTFSIKRDDWETFLEIKVAKEIMLHDPLVCYYVSQCFERVFQIIKGVVASNEKKEEDQQEESSDQKEESENNSSE